MTKFCRIVSNPDVKLKVQTEVTDEIVYAHMKQNGKQHDIPVEKHIQIIIASQLALESALERSMYMYVDTIIYT